MLLNASSTVAGVSDVSALADPPADEHERDAQLMHTWVEGDGKAFDTLHAIYRERVWRYLRRSVSDEEQARELYQDVWMRVIDRREEWQPSGRFVGWLFTIARNRVVDHHRAQTRGADKTIYIDVDTQLPETAVVSLATPLSPHRQAELAQDHARVQQALEHLPAAQKEAILLHHVAGMTLEEIGQATGHKREAVKSRLRYGVNRLRKILGAAS